MNTEVLGFLTWKQKTPEKSQQLKRANKHGAKCMDSCQLPVGAPDSPLQTRNLEGLEMMSPHVIYVFFW